MDNCTFPRYNENDIIVHLRNCLLTGSEAKSISKSDLFPNVKPEVLHMIFMRALQKVYGIRPEHFYMIPVTFETPHPQIFEGFLSVGNLFIHMERFLRLCRVYDFQIADIINPKAKRTARFLSGILNFLFFRESRCDVYLECESTYKSAVEREQQLQVAIQEAEMKLKKLDTIPADKQAEFKQLSDDIQQLEQKLNQELPKKTNALQDGIHQKRMEVTEKMQKLNELKLVTCNLKEEQNQLKSRITDSPEELSNCKERLKQSLQKTKKDKQKVIEKSEAYRDLLLILPKCQQEVQFYLNKIQTQGANVDKLSNILAEIRTLEDQIENSESRFKNDKIEEMSLKRLVSVKQEKCATIEFKIAKIREDSERQKQAITEECNKFQEKRRVVYDKLTATHTEIKQLKSAVQQLNNKTEEEKLKAQEIYLSLRVGLEKYHENLASTVESYTPGREEKIAELMKLL